ncbi:amidohydrolase [Novosphingobium sp.]|uniref:amidohydrolase n=1 Tax=Novosphingobium sp. TaxID=1874826 RepID=UPI0038BAF213
MKQPLRTLVAALLAAAPLPALADTLIDNVRGETIGADGKLETFAALLFDDGGTIKAVYHKGDKAPRRKDYQYRLDAQGKVLLPGLIDGHGHVLQTGFAALSLDLSNTTSLADALEKIRNFAAEHPDRPWILGSGWNQERWGLGRFPTAADLDKAVPGRPVWLNRADFHAGWANTVALKAAGLTAAKPDPAGGRIERLSDGTPAGVLVDNAQDLMTPAIPPPTPRDYDFALQTAQRELFRRGVTAVADMGSEIKDWQAFRRAGDANKLYVRIMSYALGLDNLLLIGGPAPSPWLYSDRLRLNGMKLVLDGALGSRGARLKQPYADKPGSTGLSLYSETQLGNLMSRAAMDDFQVAVHAIGDSANATLLHTIDDLTQTYHGDRRWRVEHAQIIDPADWPVVTHIAANGGIIASMQPVHQTSDRTMAEARLGPDRLKGAYAWASLKAAGATLAFGSDTPVELPDPWTGFAAAITRQDASGAPEGGWQPQEKVDRLTALTAYTTGAAYAGFAEKRFGRIAPGYRADFVLVDTDPMTATPEQIRKTRVLQTWVGGGRVWDADHPEGGAPPPEPAKH